MIRRVGILLVVAESQFFNPFFNNFGFFRPSVPVQCKANEEPSNCINEDSCDNRRFSLSRNCQPGCQCIPGYVRHKLKCMPRNYCPCTGPDCERPCFDRRREWFESNFGFQEPRCDENGYFQARLCNQNKCSCADRNTGQLISGTAYDMYVGGPIPDCTNLANPVFNIPKPDTKCFDKKNELERQGVSFSRLPNCNRDGSFAGRQRDPQGTFCVDASGVEIPETRNSRAGIDCDKTQASCTHGKVYHTCYYGCDTCQEHWQYNGNCPSFRMCKNGCTCPGTKIFDEYVLKCVEPVDCHQGSGMKSLSPSECFKKVNEMRKLGAFQPKCDDEGNFVTLQQNGYTRKFFCVSHDKGEKLSGFKENANSLGDCKVPDGPCAKEEFERDDLDQELVSQPPPTCDSSGYFSLKQMINNRYHCLKSKNSMDVWPETDHFDTTTFSCSEFGLVNKNWVLPESGTPIECNKNGCWCRGVSGRKLSIEDLGDCTVPTQPCLKERFFSDEGASNIKNCDENGNFERQICKKLQDVFYNLNS